MTLFFYKKCQKFSLLTSETTITPYLVKTLQHCFCIASFYFRNKSETWIQGRPVDKQKCRPMDPLSLRVQ